MNRGNSLFVDKKPLAIPLACVLVLLTACGGGSTADTKASAAPLSGNWEFVLTQQSPPSPTPVVKTESGFLVQSGSAISGGVVLTGEALCPGLGSAQGTVSGSAVTLTVSQIAQTVNLTGTTAGTGSTMSGNYSIYASGCGGGSTTGTFTADQIKALSGSYQATFTSGYPPNASSNFVVTLTQGPNAGSSNATLSGTMTSTNNACASQLSVAGLVSGSSVVFNLLAADGTAAGQFRGTTTADGTTLTGTYDFLAVTNGCSGDAGTASITRQSSL